MRKKTCGGCWAMSYCKMIDGRFPGCSLGYDYTTGEKEFENGKYGYTNQVPTEDCPKPRTYKKLVTLPKK